MVVVYRPYTQIVQRFKHSSSRLCLNLFPYVLSYEEADFIKHASWYSQIFQNDNIPSLINDNVSCSLLSPCFWHSREYTCLSWRIRMTQNVIDHSLSKRCPLYFQRKKKINILFLLICCGKSEHHNISYHAWQNEILSSPLNKLIRRVALSQFLIWLNL